MIYLENTTETQEVFIPIMEEILIKKESEDEDEN